MKISTATVAADSATTTVITVAATTVSTTDENDPQHWDDLNAGRRKRMKICCELLEVLDVV